jgi:hypothetical protein
MTIKVSRIIIDKKNIQINLPYRTISIKKDTLDLTEFNKYLYDLTSVKMSFIDVIIDNTLKYKINTNNTYTINWDLLDSERFIGIIDDLLDKIQTESEIN